MPRYSAKRAKKEQRERRGRRKQGRRRFSWTWLFGGITAVVAVIAIATALLSGGGGSSTIVAYQGEAALGGDEVTIDSLLGTGRPLILNFWAGECPPCRAEMPAFQRAYDQYQDELLLVGVDVGPFTNLGSRESAERLLRELGITYPAWFAQDRGLVRRFGVRDMPTTFFFTGDGLPFQEHRGFLSEDDLRRTITAMLETDARLPR